MEHWRCPDKKKREILFDEYLELIRQCYGMKRKTAFNEAILALTEKRRRHYAFDHHMHLKFAQAGYLNSATSSAHKNYVRIGEAIKILETERDQTQLDLSKAINS